MAQQCEDKIPHELKADVGSDSDDALLVVSSDVPEAEEEQHTTPAAADPAPQHDHFAMTEEPVEAQFEPCKSHEERIKTSHLTETEEKALQELKHLLQEALKVQDFVGSEKGGLEKEAGADKKLDLETEKDSIPGSPAQTTIARALLEDDGAKTLEAIEETIVASVRCKDKPDDKGEPQEVSIWGVKLLEDERSDVILLKFLQAREFKVKEAFLMIQNTLKWRKEFGIDDLVEEADLGRDLERVVYMYGHSREGHPVCYNVYGEFQDKELYHKTFSDEEKRQHFLKWRIQFLERSIRKLDFSPNGVSTIVQVNDLRNSPGPNRWELRQATNQALQLLQDNYPEFVAKQIFINVPWWYLALSKMISPFLTQRTKSKFVVASPSRSTDTLLKYISAEQIPTQYGGFSKGGDFGTADIVTEVIVKPSAKHIVEFPVTQECTVRWEARVVGWEVSYGAEFVPSAENGYTVIIQKMKKMNASEDKVISSSYKVGEAGKVVVTINNPTSKKKKMLYRFKAKDTASASPVAMD